jgi:hypothetical protein
MKQQLITLEVKEIGETVIPYYDDITKDFPKLGTTATCKRCGEPFTIGKAELEKAKLADDGKRPKRKLELWTPSEIIFDVDLEKQPIKVENYTFAEQCILFGVQTVYTRFCPECNAKKGEINDTEHLFGKPDRRLAE